MPNTTANPVAATLSKKAIAGNLYTTMTAAGKSRKDILLAMITTADLTQSGAATYYNNFHSGTWKVTEQAAASATADASDSVVDTTTLPALDLSKMKNTELVELYNQHASTPVKKFKSREVALQRVAEVLTATA